MICLDNSEWMRNGDYTPSRLDAQQDAANLLSTTKCDMNPENTVGLLTMGCDRVELLASPTEDSGRLLSSIAGVGLGGKSSICSGIAIARLALKHRRNKNGEQRIVVFIGSPVREALPELKKAGKMLRRYNVGLDVVSMGENEDNEEKLRVLVEAASTKDANGMSNSHLITVPAGVIPSDVLISSPVLQAGFGAAYGSEAPAAGATGAATGGGANDFLGGIDPNLDPEMAMALRVSMEEYEAQERAAKAAAEAQAGEKKEESNEMDVEEKPGEASQPSAAAEAAEGAAAADAVDEDDALLQQALAMSMADESPDGMDQVRSSLPKQLLVSDTVRSCELCRIRISPSRCRCRFRRTHRRPRRRRRRRRRAQRRLPLRATTRSSSIPSSCHSFFQTIRALILSIQTSKPPWRT